MRVLDATGKSIASAKKVTAGTGAYGPITLTNAGPFRVEACGNLNDRQICLWGVTNNGGTLNLTPLTSAITVLASGRAPDALMTGALATLPDTALATAQTQVRTALAPALADAGLASDFDLLAGALTPGSHTGQDRLLDTVGVSFGTDTKPYVVLSSRLGTGTAYLEPGTTQGSLNFDSAAAGLDLAGIDALFAKMIAAAASKDCQPQFIPLFNAGTRVTAAGQTFSGASDAAQLLCIRLSGTFDEVSFTGGKLLPSPVSRCDFSVPASPSCRVNLIFQNGSGVQVPLGVEQAVIKLPGGWSFLGNRVAVQATANARVVLTRRVDNTAADSYARFLDIRIPVVGALQCARVSQKDTSGADVPIAYFKKVSGAANLSLWSLGATDATPSLDPASGATRGANAYSMPLTGAAGDAVARNVARAGPALQIDFYKDADCVTETTTADGIADGNRIKLDLAGAPPLAANLAGQSWPQLGTTSLNALTTLKAAAAAKLTYSPAWSYVYAGTAMAKAQLCRDAACAQLVTELNLAPAAATAALSITLGSTAVNAADFKQLRLLGRTPDGLTLQLDAQACTAKGAGLPC